MKKILVIDDDPDILEALQLILKTENYDTEVTTKSDEVYQKIKDFQPDLIVLDILLSGSDGRTICSTLKNKKSSLHIPIIMISAHPTASDSAKECGADSFIAKPFSVQELLEEINKYLLTQSGLE